MRPTEIFGQVKGLIRDVAIDNMPEGFVYDMTDFIPNRKGSRVDIRGNWSFLGPAFPGNVWGGRDCRFDPTVLTPSDRLLVSAGGQIHDVNHDSGAHTVVPGVGGPATMIQNAEKLRDKVYFMDGAGLTVPTAVYPSGGALVAVSLPASAPKSKVGIVYKDRLVLAEGARARFSPLSTTGVAPNNGPLAPWDSTSYVDTSETIQGFAAMQGQILVFHTAMVERIRGNIAPATNVNGNMFVDTLSDQVGCTLPGTIVPWRENVIFADERGVYLTDGTSVKSLTEQGGVSDFWREAYRYRFQGASINCSVYLDYLLISILTTAAAKPFFVCCDLNERTWFRFNNFAASCQIPGEGSREEVYTGMYVDNKLAIVSSMFGEPYVGVNPPPNLTDGNGLLVLPSITTGFKKLGEEGLERLREVHVSYHHQSYVSPSSPNSVKVEYRISPPTPLEFDIVDIGDWQIAGNLPSTDVYTRKKLPIGKRAYGVMVRITALNGSRVSRLFSIGVKTQAQDRGKVTS
jgi:hypothetical protein